MGWMHPGGVEIFLVASCYGNQDKLQPDGPLGSNADFTLKGQFRQDLVLLENPMKLSASIGKLYTNICLTLLKPPVLITIFLNLV